MAFHINPLARTFAAEVVGFDPQQAVDAATRSELKAAFQKYKLLLFRGLDLDSAEQAQFGTLFGEHAPPPLVPGTKTSDEPNTQYVSNSRADGILPNGELGYHQDHLFDEVPVNAIMLYGVEIPTSGSATKFRSCNEIYKRLDEPTRTKAEAVRCLYLFDFAVNDANVAEQELDEKRVYFSLETASPHALRAWKPLVWRDPAGGDPAIWCNYGSTVAFEGISPGEGYQLLGDIVDLSREVEEYVHEWRVGDALIWNNLHLQHARLPFTSSEPRTLRRTTLL